MVLILLLIFLTQVLDVDHDFALSLFPLNAFFFGSSLVILPTRRQFSSMVDVVVDLEVTIGEPRPLSVTFLNY